MINQTQDLQIDRLKEQLTLFKAVYEERIRNGQEYSSLRAIEIHIRELERAI